MSNVGGLVYTQTLLPPSLTGCKNYIAVIWIDIYILFFFIYGKRYLKRVLLKFIAFSVLLFFSLLSGRKYNSLKGKKGPYTYTRSDMRIHLYKIHAPVYELLKVTKRLFVKRNLIVGLLRDRIEKNLWHIPLCETRFIAASAFY